jgi:hypothetical protein
LRNYRATILGRICAFNYALFLKERGNPSSPNYQQALINFKESVADWTPIGVNISSSGGYFSSTFDPAAGGGTTSTQRALAE